MGNEFFTPREDAWVKRVAPEFARWNNGSRDTAFFISHALQAFYAEFPYRHARNVRHERHTLSEQNLVIYGNDYGKMYERLRHKLNYVKGKKRTGVLSPTPGIVELSETLETIAARHRNEGFIHAGNSTPYAENHRLTTLKEMTATRLHLYGPGDVSCVSNEQRGRYLLDLPQDMEDIVETLSEHTGAEIYMIAGWDDGASEYHYYDAASKRSQRLLYTETQYDGDGIRDRFLELQRRRNNLVSPRFCEQALPAVYGAFDGSWRPILPALYMSWESMIPTMVSYFEYLWEWQGGELPVPWEDEGDLNSDTRIAQSYRLPAGIPLLTHPDDWDKLTTLKWRDHIYAGQHGEISVKHRFQYYTLSETLVDSDYRTVMHPESFLRYDGASRLWTARLLRQEGGDALARDELFFQLPLVPGPGESPRPWDEDELEDIYKHSLKFQPLLQLLDGVIKYERKGPIQAAPGQWVRYWTFSLQFTEHIPGPSAFIQALHGWWIPESYFTANTTNDDWSMRKQSVFIRYGLFQHELTKTILGGPFGIKWAALLLVRSYWSLQSLLDGASHPYSVKSKRDATRGYSADLRVVLDDIEWLRAELVRSSEILDRARTIAEKRQYTNLTLPEPTVCRVEPAEIPSPGPSRSPSPPAPRSILKGSEQVKSRGTKMVVVLPTPWARRASSKKSEGVEDTEMEEPEEREPESMDWEDEDVGASAPKQPSPVTTPRTKQRRYGKKVPSRTSPDTTRKRQRM